MISAPLTNQSRPSDSQSLKTIHVLIVEDQEDDFLLIQRMLRKAVFARYVPQWCSTYEDGLSALAERKHDVALFDYNLGIRNGLDLLRKALSMGCEQPVILLTGHDSIEVDREALGAGASDYLSKNDLNITLLERSIRYALRHATMLSSVRKSQRQLELFMRSVPCAVCIRDEKGRYVFQNSRFRTHFAGASPESIWGSTDLAEPRSFTDGQHYWLVNSFAMEDDGRGLLQGLAAIEITERVKAEEALLKTTGLLDGILKALPVIAWSVDEEGAILEARGSGLEGVGLNGEQVIGRSLVDFSTSVATEVAKAFKTGTANFILPIMHKGQEHSFDTFLHHSRGPVRTAVGFSVDITERRWLEKKLLHISDGEQMRIGADLHDGLGQYLTGIACLSVVLREQLKAQELPETQQADEIARLVNEANQQTRALARGLCPVQLIQNGLHSALEQLTYQMEVMHGVDCQFDSPEEEFDCDHDSALHLYRIAQEALNNAVRHGKAKRIEVTLDSCPRGRRLVIDDHGEGFEPQKKNKGPGVGLRLMHYRAAMIGGNLSIESQSMRGTRVECILPFETVRRNHDGSSASEGT